MNQTRPLFHRKSRPAIWLSLALLLVQLGLLTHPVHDFALAADTDTCDICLLAGHFDDALTTEATTPVIVSVQDSLITLRVAAPQQPASAGYQSRAPPLTSPS